MRATVPSIHCDWEFGCDTWDVDFYETNAHSVGAVRITEAQRAPGWSSCDHEDFCPQHADEVQS